MRNLATVGLFLLGLGALTQDQIETVPVSDNIFMLMGGGGNIGICRGDDGVFMVDDQFAPVTEKIKTAVAAISNKPIKFLINTHWHFDHTGGNENFGKEAAVIVAHEKVRQQMSAGQFMKDFNMKIDPAPSVALPVVTFTKELSFHLNDEEIHVFHVENAHTEGDAIIHFRKANVVHTGDCFFNGFYPYIDIYSGGSIDGMIRVAGRLLNLVDDETKIIPGHGPLARRADLIAFRDMLVGVRAAVRKPVSEGKSLEEVKALKPTAAFDGHWGSGFLNPDKFTEIVYNDLARGYESKY